MRILEKLQAHRLCQGQFWVPQAAASFRIVFDFGFFFRVAQQQADESRQSTSYMLILVSYKYVPGVLCTRIREQGFPFGLVVELSGGCRELERE